MRLLFILALSLISIPVLAQSPKQLTLPNGLGAFSMAQDQNGTVYVEQGDATWYAFLGWSLNPSSDLTGNPVLLVPGPLDVPNVSGPFNPSPDGTTITAPNGTVTSVDGVWTWGANANGTDYVLILNGASIGRAASRVSATTLTINAQGNAFYHIAHTGEDKVFLAYNIGSSGLPTAGPIPVGIRFNPSYYSNFTTCVPASTPPTGTCAPGLSIAALNTAGTNHAGTLISTITVTMSDNSTFVGAYQFFNQQAGGAFQLVGNQVQLARALTNSDLATSVGGPLGCFAWPVQNGVTLSNGWYFLQVTVVP